MKRVYLTILILSVVMVLGAWNISKSRTFQVFGEVVAKAETNEKVIALTFDDGPWGGKYTTQVLNILEEHDVKGTFFLNGSGIQQNKQSAIDLVNAGHQIGNHSYNHKNMTLMGLDEVRDEVDSTTALIRQIGFEGEIYFRPPYGKKLFVLPYYLNSEGIKTITWNVEPETYPKVAGSSASIAEYVVNSSTPGSIILLHVLGSKNKESRDAIGPIIKGLRAKGYKFVTVSQLLGESA
ncbi:polysaccharide deacetylase family protein [Pseudoalteromonas ruthenica]|uniref:Polysaccharide deacetylase n=1 Tax=Pseudoalteromonas ruthenica TaxID=151081 RepID=A0A0F4PXL9_9GAMM|nr:polysaccharide deacetylase family protein [Pseudoalteromonas ruthenica]KJY99144.1 polysaccharide deacetylase [Pseudoalteromonas ruthenica]KJY99813.1 polysaccharide deacetylase [Pseudoalteromonas ruthenica]